MNFTSSQGIKFHYEFSAAKDKSIPLLFLHGFSGSSKDWNFIKENLKNKYDIYTIDLIGHGFSDSPADGAFYSTSNQINYLQEFVENVIQTKPVIIGYSMGGRLALQFGIKHQDLLSGLIIESSTPGIEDINEKGKRKEWDESIARMIQERGIEYFAEHWINLPILKDSYRNANLPFQSIINSKVQNNPTGLANSIKFFGTGTMPQCWDKLNSLKIPVGIIYGERDTKYEEISRKIAGQISDSVLYPIQSAGHIAHLEKPEEFINFVDQFCDKLKSKG
ncbi:MAG: 2-succinyl-6-hydroxy-2,4-cyclohexadiene-1-carboxylate synthase [Ignavibacteria bacterium]|nr:MAG: 2-succinyl-6-hydroxy-2,4-cyclohexadiene-1-carboxylate synthase [Ignavibacteria bacterium]